MYIFAKNIYHSYTLFNIVPLLMDNEIKDIVSE